VECQHDPDRMPTIRRIPDPDGQEHEAERIGFRSSGDHFNEYLLDDGSVLRIKLVLTDVWKVKETYDALGNPVYLVEHSEVMAVDAPDDLREGGEASA
jgi:hypothetical protein